MRNFLESIDVFDVVDHVQSRAKSAVHRKYLVVDYGADRKEVKNVCELLPDLWRAVFALALGVEAVDLRDLPSLVVATQQAYSLWIPDLEQE